MFSFRFWIANHPGRCRYDSNESNFEDAVNDLIKGAPRCFGCKVSEIDKIFQNGKRLGKKYLVYAQNKINS